MNKAYLFNSDSETSDGLSRTAAVCEPSQCGLVSRADLERQSVAAWFDKPTVQFVN